MFCLDQLLLTLLLVQSVLLLAEQGVELRITAVAVAAHVAAGQHAAKAVRVTLMTRRQQSEVKVVLFESLTQLWPLLQAQRDLDTEGVQLCCDCFGQ